MWSRAEMGWWVPLALATCTALIFLIGAFGCSTAEQQRLKADQAKVNQVILTIAKDAYDLQSKLCHDNAQAQAALAKAQDVANLPLVAPLTASYASEIKAGLAVVAEGLVIQAKVCAALKLT